MQVVQKINENKPKSRQVHMPDDLVELCDGLAQDQSAKMNGRVTRSEVICAILRTAFKTKGFKIEIEAK